MTDLEKIDYASLDRPDILMFLFHPRPEWGSPGAKTATSDIMIPVEKDVAIGARFHLANQAAPNILFFHGNGEIAADYDDLAPHYEGLGINFLPVDYRGYGRSTGTPTITAMMQDCHVIYAFVRKWLKENGYWGPIVVMGRSLGSASALELAASYPDQIRGLIIESGFAWAGPLLSLLGIDIETIGFREETSFLNQEKIARFSTGPVLVIHAENDQIIPFSDGLALFEACPAADKTILRIPGADHNNIFALGLVPYLEAIRNLMQAIG
jgi:pimeloyl-ACP methyl ester carboxylesterase